MAEILRVEDLKKYFATKKGTLHAVDGVTFTVDAGKTLGIVGESGCGKSTLGRVILHLHERTEGRIVFQGEDISDVSNAKLKELRKIRRLLQNLLSAADMSVHLHSQEPHRCLFHSYLLPFFEIQYLDYGSQGVDDEWTPGNTSPNATQGHAVESNLCILQHIHQQGR